MRKIKALLISMLVLFGGCTSEKSEIIVEKNAKEIMRNVIKYSYRNPINQEVFDTEDFSGKSKKVFSQYVLPECYEKMRGDILMNPLFIQEEYEIEIENTIEYDNSISTTCILIFDSYSIRINMSFVKEDGKYYATGMKYYIRYE